MDVVDRCKDKLEHFRIKELKDILSRVGISKQGRKQDLMDRVLAVLYDEGSPGLFKHINGKEELIAIIDDAHRKMQDEGVTDSNAKKQSSASNHRKQLQEEAEPVKVRCVCGRSGVVDLPIQCANPNCYVWQHTGCVLSTERDIKKHPFETQFFCQTCRIERADPFWETVDHLLYPVKLLVSSIPDDGSKPYQHIEKTFELSKVNKDFLVKAEYDVQAWCMLIFDSVPFRVQWPHYAELLVNGVPFKTYSRPGSHPLGANGRDDGVKITLFLVDGVNKISLSGCDDRDFCLGLRLVRRQTLQQVMSIIPQESVGESFEDALARVKRCTGGGGVVAEHEESDSDLEVVTDSITVSLRCPMSGCRMKTAGRFKSCVHMGCFDLEAFIQLNERSRKWQCPICLKNYSLENIAIDPYFNRILNMMRDCREEISEIELKPDGSWRVKNEVAIKDLSLWHCPDGSLSIPSGPSKPILNENLSWKHDNTAPGKQENMVARTVGQPEDMSQLNLLDTQVTNFDQEVITMSSSSSEDHRDDAFPSFKDSGEVNSFPPKNGMPQGNGDRNSSAQVMIADVIILSDSDEEEVSLFRPDSSTTMVGYEKNEISPTALPESADPHLALMADSSNKTNHDVRTPQLPSASISEKCSGFHSINIATENLEAVTEFHQTPPTTSSLGDVCKMVTVDGGRSGNPAVDSSVLPNDVIANNSVAQDFVTCVDSNLHGQNSLAEAPVSGNMTPVQNTTPSGEASFREGSYGNEGCSGVESRVQPTGTNQMESLVYVRSKRRLSILPNTNGESCLDLDVSRKRTGGPFSFPRRQRSGRRHQN